MTTQYCCVVTAGLMLWCFCDHDNILFTILLGGSFLWWHFCWSGVSVMVVFHIQKFALLWSIASDFLRQKLYCTCNIAVCLNSFSILFSAFVESHVMNGERVLLNSNLEVNNVNNDDKAHISLFFRFTVIFMIFGNFLQACCSGAYR
jgi:hypothetical protein